MPLGQTIRALFGQHERRISALYRALFLDLDDFSAKIRDWAPDTTRILEVGCGEGAVTERLAHIFPEATILAIDITPRAGRLYEGPKEDVTFETATIQEIAMRKPCEFDLVVMSDVLHHIPDDLRAEIVEAIGRTMAPGARLVIKDWERTHTLIHWLCHASDRWLTGDRVVHMKPADVSRLVQSRLPALARVAEGYIRPWRNNYALVFTS